MSDRMWVVMRAASFKNIEIVPDHSVVVGSLPWEVRVNPPEGEPYLYLPVFETHAAALRWTDGDPTHIREVMLG